MLGYRVTFDIGSFLVMLDLKFAKGFNIIKIEIIYMGDKYFRAGNFYYKYLL